MRIFPQGGADKKVQVARNQVCMYDIESRVSIAPGSII
jgi:hypothetical protein